MHNLIETIPLLLAPFIACVAITALHGYVGLHVIKRGVIFVDLALSQCAALGAAVALFVAPWICAQPEHGHDHESRSAAVSRVAAELELESNLDLDHVDRHDHFEPEQTPKRLGVIGHETLTYVMSLGFALLGAILLSFARLRDERIPHEAIIGIIFVVCASLSVLILSKAPHGHEKIEAMLVGSILFVQWSELASMLPLYALLGVLHILLRGPFIRISLDLPAAERAGVSVRLWDCLFYGLFAILVTHSVSIAGVFVVFSYLIIPPACATLMADRFGSQVVIAWGVGILTTVLGLFVSAAGDMPTGSSLVSCFGGVLVLVFLARALFIKKQTRSDKA
ncbi:MAG: metal ABC transporter permease [Phycisphaerae bacterium]